jgi:hypothetical protein
MAAPQYPAIYFAWVDAGTAFNASVHNRRDEQVIGFKVEHSEGEFPGLQLTIKNPLVPLLAAGRKQWAWLSWDKTGTGAQPLFFGRVIGIPSDIHRESIILEFIARPDDYLARKTTLANTLKVAPFYDPLFISEADRANPDTAWEARTSLWHIDRVTHTVTDSDLLVGEDGLEIFQASEIAYDSVKINFDGTPVRRVEATVNVGWDQKSSRSGGLYLLPVDFSIDSYTGEGLVSTWPKPGDKLDGGWTAGPATFIRTDIENIDSVSNNQSVEGDDGSTASVSSTFPAYGGDFGHPFEKGQRFETSHGASMTVGIGGQTASASQSSSGFWLALHTIRAQMDYGYEVSRSRSEVVNIIVEANVQPILTMPGAEEIVQLQLSGADPTVQIGASVPIGSADRRTFFQTTRGLQAIEYILMLCRAKIAAAARAVATEFDCKFERATDLSCRKNVQVYDRRIPGGNALGKVIYYSFELQDGKFFGHVKIGSAIGYGGTVVAADGEPVYIDDDYIESDYQEHTDDIVVVAAGAIGYSTAIGSINDDGIIFPIRTLPVHNFQIENPPSYATEPWMPNSVSPANLQELISEKAKTSFTKITVDLPNLDAGPFQSVFTVTTTPLEIPQQMNLGA